MTHYHLLSSIQTIHIFICVLDSRNSKRVNVSVLTIDEEPLLNLLMEFGLCDAERGVTQLCKPFIAVIYAPNLMPFCTRIYP